MRRLSFQEDCVRIQAFAREPYRVNTFSVDDLRFASFFLLVILTNTKSLEESQIRKECQFSSTSCHTCNAGGTASLVVILSKHVVQTKTPRTRVGGTSCANSAIRKNVSTANCATGSFIIQVIFQYKPLAAITSGELSFDPRSERFVYAKHPIIR